MTSQSNEHLLSFSFKHSNIRGAIVHLQDDYTQLISQNGNQPPYPLFVKHLLGEMAASLLLMASNVKIVGCMSLQIRGSGHLYSVFVEVKIKAGAPLKIRGIARRQDEHQPNSLDLRDWLGNARSLAISLLPDEGKPYQGIVPLESPRLGQCLEAYYQLSEQLPTYFWFQIQDNHCAALMLQQLPNQTSTDINLDTAKMLADTLSPGELISISSKQLLHRLFHEYALTEHDQKPIAYECSCSKARMTETILSLGKTALEQMVNENPAIEITCQFCGTAHTFDGQTLLNNISDQSRTD